MQFSYWYDQSMILESLSIENCLISPEFAIQWSHFPDQLLYESFIWSWNEVNDILDFLQIIKYGRTTNELQFPVFFYSKNSLQWWKLIWFWCWVTFNSLIRLKLHDVHHPMSMTKSKNSCNTKASILKFKTENNSICDNWYW